MLKSDSLSAPFLPCCGNTEPFDLPMDCVGKRQFRGKLSLRRLTSPWQTQTPRPLICSQNASVKNSSTSRHETASPLSKKSQWNPASGSCWRVGCGPTTKTRAEPRPSRPHRRSRLNHKQSPVSHAPELPWPQDVLRAGQSVEHGFGRTEGACDGGGDGQALRAGPGDGRRGGPGVRCARWARHGAARTMGRFSLNVSILNRWR